MESNPPRTAKEAALQGAQADKPLFNREADRRYIINSIIRRAGEFFGQNDQPTQAAKVIQPGSETFDTLSSQERLSLASADSRPAGDLSLADMIVADQAASRGFAAPPATSDDNRLPLLDSWVDATAPANWTPGDLTQDDASASPSTLSEFTSSIGRTIFSEMLPAAPHFEFPPIRNSQFDASAFSPLNPPSLDSTFPPGISDLVDRIGDTDPSSIVQLPYRPAGEMSGPKVELFSSGAGSPDPLSAAQDRAPITYQPFGQSAAASNDASAPREKRRFEFESGFADLGKDVTVAFLKMEPAILKAIDRAGEQDRRDALMREASFRACL